MILIPCLRQSHDTQWQFIFVSMMLFYSSFPLLFGWACGLVPGGAKIQDAALTSDEQPVLSAPRCRPLWLCLWLSFVVVLSCVFLWQLKMTPINQDVVYFVWWSWYSGAMQPLWLFFNGGNMVHCWWQDAVQYCLVVASILCLRAYYDDSYQFISLSLLLPCFASWLPHGYLGGFVPVGTVLNGVAPSHGEQPIPSAPRCWPGWPSRSMMMPSFSETFVAIFLYDLVTMSPPLRAYPHSGCLYTNLLITYFDVCLFLSLSVPLFTALFLHIYWFLVTGSCCWTLNTWITHSLCIQFFCLCPLTSWCVVHKSFGLPIFHLYKIILDFWISREVLLFVLFSYCFLLRDPLSICSMASEGANPSKALFQTAFGLSYFCFLARLSFCCGYDHSPRCCVCPFAFDVKTLALPFTLFYENY